MDGTCTEEDFAVRKALGVPATSSERCGVLRYQER